MHHRHVETSNLEALTYPKSPSKSDAWATQALPPSYLEWRQEEERILLRHIRTGDYVADFCCGDGRLIPAILRRASRYEGCDCDCEAIARANLVGSRFGDRVGLVQCDFKLFSPVDGTRRPDIALCVGNSLAALPYPLIESLTHMAANSRRDIFASVIRKGTVSIRKEYYDLLGVPFTYDADTEVFHSQVWGTSAAYSSDELEAACKAAGLRDVAVQPVGKLGWIVTAQSS